MNCTYTFWSHPLTTALLGAAVGAILSALLDIRGRVQRVFKPVSKVNMTRSPGAGQQTAQGDGNRQSMNIINKP